MVDFTVVNQKNPVLLSDLTMAQQEYLEHRIRELIQKTDNDRRDLLIEVKALVDLVYDMREKIAVLELSFRKHEQWSDSQAIKISNLENNGAEQRLKERESQIRLDWWAWLIGSLGVVGGIALKAAWEWSRGGK